MAAHYIGLGKLLYYTIRLYTGALPMALTPRRSARAVTRRTPIVVVCEGREMERERDWTEGESERHRDASRVRVKESERGK